jgi:hypothetical protein
MERIEIKAVDLVRRIRDQHSVMLQGKTFEEIVAFFHQEALAANDEASLLLQTQRDSSQVSLSHPASPTLQQEEITPFAA